MASRLRWWTWALVLLVLAEGAALGALLLRSRWQRSAEGAPVQRGYRVAERMGCFGCHGPSGAAGIANPGTDGTVPAWSDGTWMMYNDTEEDVRAWIVDGHAPGTAVDPEALIRMPAYKTRLSAAELDDLTAYVLTEMRFGDPADSGDKQAAAGRDAALRLGCFGCHGAEGRGLVANPGSLKGHIPAWDGADYAELVQSPEELRQWVRNGVSDRFRDNPAARRFVERQVIQMPAYKDKVSDADLAAIQSYIEWARSHPRGGARHQTSR